MPRMKNDKRDYSQQRQYNATPEATRKRVLNNAARRAAISSGDASVGDGTNVDHKTPLSRGGTNKKSNLRVVSESKNKSFSRDSKSRLVSQTSKRERKK